MRTNAPEIDDPFGADVGALLHAEVLDVQSGTALMPTLRRKHAQRTWALRAAVVTPLAAATAFAVMLGAANGTTGPGGAPPVAGPGSVAATGGVAELPAIELVAARTVAALDTLGDKIVKSHTSAGQWSTDTYRDPVTGHDRTDTFDNGRLARSSWTSGPVTDRDAVFTYVDYESRTWFSQPVYRPGDEGHIPTEVEDYTDPAYIKAALAAGKLTLVGPEQLDGHATQHLFVTAVAELGQQEGVELSFDLWVDAATYVPYRHRINKGGHVADVTLTWLPRSPENLAKVELTPPAGFINKVNEGESGSNQPGVG